MIYILSCFNDRCYTRAEFSNAKLWLVILKTILHLLNDYCKSVQCNIQLESSRYSCKLDFNYTILLPIDNVLYSILFIPFTEKKNDSTVVPYSFNPEGLLGSHLCDVIPPALLIMVQFLFCGRESKQRISLRVKKIYVFFLFLRLRL